MQNLQSLNVHFIRFFTEESHVSLFRSGKFRMMSMNHYKELEKVSSVLYTNRYDSIENSLYVINPNKDGDIILKEPIKLGNDTITEINVLPGTLFNPILISNNTLDEITKILCLYMLPLDEIKDNKISSVLSTMKESLGDYYCLITDTTEFVSKVINAISYGTSINIVRNGELGIVDYVDENKFCGSYGPFKKPQGLSWQNEFRIKLETLNKDPFVIPIGNIENISIWGKVSDLKKGYLYKDQSLNVPINIPNCRW